VWSFHWATRTGGVRRFLACGAITGLALLTKFTALLLGPVYLVLALVLLQRRRLGATTLGRGLAIVLAAAFVVVGAGYGFSFDGALYLRGLSRVWAVGRPGYLFYLFGQLSAEPFWYYGLCAFLVKVPVPTLLLLALACAGLAVERDRLEAALFLLVPAAAVVGASFFDRANIGLRHLLPAFPFLLAFTAQALAGRRRRLLRGVLCGGLIVWLAVDAVRIHPHHLSYFNEAVGGPGNGPYLLDDSNIDWGQDLPALADWQRAHRDEPLALLYFGNVPPEAYGVHGEPPPDEDIVSPRPGTYAISVQHLVGFRRLAATAGLDVDWLTRFRPVARAGWSIYIYRFE